MSTTLRRIAIVLCAAVFWGAIPRLNWSAESAESPGANLKTRVINAQWEYSTDGGKTFGNAMPPGAPPNMKEGIAPRAFRGSFEIDDPDSVAGLWVRLVAKQAETSKPSICTGDLIAASGGYWKDVGFCPTLLNTRALLNGKPVATTHGPMLYFWLPLEGVVQKGKNTLELGGDCYTYWGSKPAESLTLEIVAAEPQPAMIEYGPVLGDFGDGYFTLSCRTQFPAELVLDATPTEPSGKMVTVTSPRAMQHRLKIPIPSGTKSVSYSVRSRVGSHEFHRPPMTVAFPGKEFRFVVLGNLLAHNIQVDRVRLISERIMAAKAAFVVNTGNVSEHGSWHFDWDRRYFNPAGKMVATIPTFITPGSRDFAGIIHEMHVTPAENRYSHNWSKAIGPIRLIGIDGNDNWQAGGENAKWLDKELSAVKEKFVFALNAYPAYSSGRNSKKMYPTIVQGREVIMPLLSKHHVAAMLSGSDPDYERCEPTPDKGVTQIVIGNSGKDSFRFSGPAIGQNPFSKGKGTEWAGAEARSILIFDVKEDAVEMKCVAMSDDPNQKDENEYHVFDRKKFTPRPGK